MSFQVKTVSGEPDVLLNDPNLTVGGSRDYLDQLDHSRPLYLPGYVHAVFTHTPVDRSDCPLSAGREFIHVSTRFQQELKESKLLRGGLMLELKCLSLQRL